MVPKWWGWWCKSWTEEETEVHVLNVLNLCEANLKHHYRNDDDDVTTPDTRFHLLGKMMLPLAASFQ